MSPSTHKRLLLVSLVGAVCGADANPLSNILAGLAVLKARLFGGAPQPPYYQHPGFRPGQSGYQGQFPGRPGIQGQQRYTYTTLYPLPAPTTTRPLTAEEWWATTTEGTQPTTARIEGTPQDYETMPEQEVLKTAPWTAPESAAAACTERFTAPSPPQHATDWNGVKLPDVCFTGKYGPYHVFAIGDWGGVLHQSGWIQPADHRSKMFRSHHRKFILSVDDMAQKNVAAEMAKRAQASNPDYVLNVGDNFYWGGIQTKCGAPGHKANDASHQWEHVFENMYRGPGLDGKQWLGVLGNHDYGGFMFTMGWDQAISYTWAAGKVPTSTGRWMTPAQYWSVKVRYLDFVVDYYFVDNNVFDAFVPDDQPFHNMCSRQHNLQEGATCGQQGPVSTDDCPGWFKRLWDAQQTWLNSNLATSAAEWQIVVAHFPPEGAWGEDIIRGLAYTYGIDMIIAGHRHKQSMSYMEGNSLAPTAVIVTGGGGGITSEYAPDPQGIDDQYGFADLTLTKGEIMVEMISHRGAIRSTTCVTPRDRQAMQPRGPVPNSLCTGRPPRGPKSREPQIGDPSIAVEPGDAPAPAPVPAPAAVFRRRLAADALEGAEAAVGNRSGAFLV